MLGKGHWARTAIGVTVGLLLLIPVLMTFAYRFIPPPITPLMVIRSLVGNGINKAWRPLRDISPDVLQAVIAAEDTRFCQHHGFDWEAMKRSWEAYGKGQPLIGASTITMQTAKNLFLWPHRSYLRKAIEAYITPILELILGKDRILEIYLNIVEWDDGIYGIESAARAHFGKSAKLVSAREATLLAAVLPNPRRWSAGNPTAYIRERANTIRARMAQSTRRVQAICALG
jgi:monofunctional biosynthetic peptidoglycan transglycosylase